MCNSHNCIANKKYNRTKFPLQKPNFIKYKHRTRFSKIKERVENLKSPNIRRFLNSRRYLVPRKGKTQLAFDTGNISFCRGTFIDRAANIKTIVQTYSFNFMTRICVTYSRCVRQIGERGTSLKKSSQERILFPLSRREKKTAAKQPPQDNYPTLLNISCMTGQGQIIKGDLNFRTSYRRQIRIYKFGLLISFRKFVASLKGAGNFNY